ncbi:MAG TPA: PAAR domain-containing protein [Longimicrobiaceae bacterium]|nr:PAAR domain-containing protein [Longimicrobiaceae bacterium]
MRPAARLGDMHTCPMVTGTVPHVGGPILPPCAPTVLIAGMPAARVGDLATCVGPPDTIAMGSTGVFIAGKPAARLGDPTVHGGVIVAGCPTVLIGEVGAGGAGSAQGRTMRAAKQAAMPFTKTDCDGKLSPAAEGNPDDPPPQAQGGTKRKREDEEPDVESSTPPEPKKPRTHFSQELNNSCVVASSRNLIHQLTGIDVPEDQLREEMRGIMNLPAHDFNKDPINPLHAVKLLKSHGVETSVERNVSSAGLGALVRDDKPVMIGFKNPGHRVILEKVETAADGARTYIVQDPAKRFGGEPRRMNQSEFDKKYNPSAVVIVPK